jgi:hypothetical protein
MTRFIHFIPFSGIQSWIIQDIAFGIYLILCKIYLDFNGSDDGVKHRITGFSDFSIVWYSREHDVSETDPVSETSCSRTPDDGKSPKIQ